MFIIDERKHSAKQEKKEIEENIVKQNLFEHGRHWRFPLFSFFVCISIFFLLFILLIRLSYSCLLDLNVLR